jgi:hypothetical protein
MATSEKALIKIETGQTPLAMTAMTDSGDHQVFYLTGVKRWSGKSGYAPIIKPDGITQGLNVIVPDGAGAVNVVENLAFKANAGGVEYTVPAASNVTVTRPATNVAKVNSICMTDTGTLEAVAGTDGATATFSETRGAAGGPPLITVGYVELAQVRLITSADAPITAEQIFQSPGVHCERADYPMYQEPNCVGDGLDAENTYQTDAYLKFESALPAIHVGPTVKKVFIKVNTPILSELSRTSAFAPAEYSNSSQSEAYYGGAAVSPQKSLGQCSFSALLNTGILDPVLRQRDQNVIVEFYQDRDQSAKVVQQGIFGVKRTFPQGNQIKGEFTMTCQYPSVDFTE